IRRRGRGDRGCGSFLLRRILLRRVGLGRVLLGGLLGSVGLGGVIRVTGLRLIGGVDGQGDESRQRARREGRAHFLPFHAFSFVSELVLPVRGRGNTGALAWETRRTGTAPNYAQLGKAGKGNLAGEGGKNAERCPGATTASKGAII